MLPSPAKAVRFQKQHATVTPLKGVLKKPEVVIPRFVWFYFNSLFYLRIINVANRMSESSKSIHDGWDSGEDAAAKWVLTDLLHTHPFWLWDRLALQLRPKVNTNIPLTMWARVILALPSKREVGQMWLHLGKSAYHIIFPLTVVLKDECVMFCQDCFERPFHRRWYCFPGWFEHQVSCVVVAYVLGRRVWNLPWIVWPIRVGMKPISETGIQPWKKHIKA
jgi:hypothetical protein